MSAKGARLQALEAPRGWGLGRGLPLPSRLGGLGERRKLTSGVRGGVPAAKGFGTLCAYKTTLVALKISHSIVVNFVFLLDETAQ